MVFKYASSVSDLSVSNFQVPSKSCTETAFADSGNLADSNAKDCPPTYILAGFPQYTGVAFSYYYVLIFTFRRLSFRS